MNRISDYGLYLSNSEGDEVLLPNRYVSLQNRVGDELRVFVYHDSEDRLVATTEHPAAAVGQAAFLRVVDRNDHGAFLDWGLQGKDLFLPNRNQQGGVITGRPCIVFLYEDPVTGRAVATMKLKGFVSNDNITVSKGQRVRMLVASRSDIGFRVIIESRHWGMLYFNRTFRPVSVGEQLEGWIYRITGDGRIDVSLQQSGYGGVQDAARQLTEIMRQAGGSLPVGDDSDPELIMRLAGMSKKQFKRALGTLLSSGAAEKFPEGIKLTER